MREKLTKAIIRASSAILSSKTTCALYFANGKLHASRPEAATHELRMKVHADGLVGVYTVDALEDALDDLMEFYK